MHNPIIASAGFPSEFTRARPARGQPSARCMNWNFGWGLLLAGFLSGAILGLGFHRADFLGGYDSFPRRMLRLGHIACCALGMLNLMVAVAGHASPWLLAGGVAMPVVCFLAAWRKPFRHLFVIPVACLLAAVIREMIP